MPHQIIHQNKFCLDKYLSIKKHVQEDDTMWKVYKLIPCCDKFKQMKNDVFLNFEARYIFEMLHEIYGHEFITTSVTSYFCEETFVLQNLYCFSKDLWNKVLYMTSYFKLTMSFLMQRNECVYQTW